MTEEITPEAIEEASPKEIGERISAMVEEEAARAEAETPDEDEEGAEEEEIDPRQRAIMQGLGEYLEIVQANLPEGVTVNPCVFCHGFGFNPIELRKSPHHEQCPDCGGQGRYATDSFVPGNENAMCLTCNGRGFVNLNNAPVAVAPVNTPEPFPVLTAEEVQRIAAEAQARAGVNAA